MKFATGTQPVHLIYLASTDFTKRFVEVGNYFSVAEVFALLFLFMEHVRKMVSSFYPKKCFGLVFHSIQFQFTPKQTFFKRAEQYFIQFDALALFWHCLEM